MPAAATIYWCLVSFSSYPLTALIQFKYIYECIVSISSFKYQQIFGLASATMLAVNPQ